MGGQGGYKRPVKEESQARGGKIDAGVCSVGAYWAARRCLAMREKMFVNYIADDEVAYGSSMFDMDDSAGSGMFDLD